MEIHRFDDGSTHVQIVPSSQILDNTNALQGETFLKTGMITLHKELVQLE